jgi:hypothetical protein
VVPVVPDEPVDPVVLPDEVIPLEPDVVVEPLVDVLPPELSAEVEEPDDELRDVPLVEVAMGAVPEAQPARAKASKSCHPVCLIVIAAKPSTLGPNPQNGGLRKGPTAGKRKQLPPDKVVAYIRR